MTHAEALTIALTTLGTFNGYVQQAEAKVTTVVTIHLGAAALAATQAGGMAPLWAAGPASAVGATILLLSFCVGFLVAGYHLALGLRPNLKGPGGVNRFGLVRPAKADRPTAPVGKQLEEIQLLIEVFRTVALRKHRRVRRALPWMALTFASVIIWTAITALAR
ncbi:hypothetical protein ACFYOK_18130 [Microbispora bryophytorum]|uniref:hypothetical protein n=1 Tax=Microbispora bryophytorum TaxID=1460882 RepID=UPI0033F2F9B2